MSIVINITTVANNPYESVISWHVDVVYNCMMQARCDIDKAIVNWGDNYLHLAMYDNINDNIQYLNKCFDLDVDRLWQG